MCYRKLDPPWCLDLGVFSRFLHTLVITTTTTTEDNDDSNKITTPTPTTTTVIIIIMRFGIYLNRLFLAVVLEG